MRLRIVEPCSEDWSAMTPTEGGRFCAHCREDVVDLARVSRREAERAVRGGARCAQLAVDADGRAVFAPEQPGPLAKLALRAAIAGALASGCSGEEPPPPPAPIELEAPCDASPADPLDAEPLELGVGSGSLLTGHGDAIPRATQRPLPPAAPLAPPPATRGNHEAPPPIAPPTQVDPPAHELAPPIRHLRGRIAFHR